MCNTKQQTRVHVKIQTENECIECECIIRVKIGLDSPKDL